MLEGVNVAVRPTSFNATTPATAVAEGPVTVKVDAMMVPGIISSLKVAVMKPLMGTPVAASAGDVELTVGAMVSTTVGGEQPTMKPVRSAIMKNDLMYFFIGYILDRELCGDVAVHGQRYGGISRN